MSSAPLLLSVKDAFVRYQDKVIFDDLSFNIHQGNKICLIGKNGAGKTTLMRMITGQRELDAGDRWQQNGLTIGYLQQDVVFQPDQTVFDYIFEEIKGAEIRELHAYKVEMVIEPLELDPNAKMSVLSGGQLRRAALARALVEEPDVLLLDEPTNHMDLDVVQWLEEYLQNYNGTFLCVSHDKTFLKNISNTVFWLDRGRLRVCPRGYEYFDEWSTMLIEQERRELHNRQKYVEHEVEWASKGVKARRKRNVRRLEQMREARDKLKADKSAFNQMMATIKIPPGEGESSSRIIAEFYNVSKSFERDGKNIPIIKNFNFRITRGDRIGILGKNGSGKTTFLKMLVGELEPDKGSVKVGKTIEFSYFDQKRSNLDPDASLWTNLCPNGGDYVDVFGKPRHVCGYLRDFLFDPSRARDRVSILSGGEKNRLMLAKVLANPGDFLILDEPTNDLDMDTLEILEEVIDQYKGTLIIVSHDRDFLDQTVHKILAFEGDAQIDGYIGGYTDYLEEKAKKSKPNKGNKPVTDKSDTKTTNNAKPKPEPDKITYNDKYQWETLPKNIKALEDEIAQMDAEMADPDLYGKNPDRFETLTKRYGHAKTELEEAEIRWLELDEMMQSAQV